MRESRLQGTISLEEPRDSARTLGTDVPLVIWLGQVPEVSGRPVAQPLEGMFGDDEMIGRLGDTPCLADRNCSRAARLDADFVPSSWNSGGKFIHAFGDGVAMTISPVVRIQRLRVHFWRNESQGHRRLASSDVVVLKESGRSSVPGVIAGAEAVGGAN